MARMPLRLSVWDMAAARARTWKRRAAYTGGHRCAGSESARPLPICGMGRALRPPYSDCVSGGDWRVCIADVLPPAFRVAALNAVGSIHATQGYRLVELGTNRMLQPKKEQRGFVDIDARA